MKILIAYASNESHGDTGLNIMVWPDSAMIRSRKPLFLPNEDVRLLPGFVAKISAVGKSIRHKFAGRYYQELAPAAFVLDSRPARMITEHLDPPACDLASDFSIICGDFVDKESLISDISAASPWIEILKLGAGDCLLREQLNFGEPADRIDSAIVAASRRNTLKTGDLAGFVSDLAFSVSPDSLLRVGVGDKILIENKLK